jgi:site-specific DNA recombinase
MTNAETLPVAIYARYSTDRQDARSIEDQLRRCRRFAGERGFEIVAEYRDAAQSGATLQRADMQRLLAEAKRGRRCPFRAVLVDDLSRLSRDLGNTWRVVFEDLAAATVRVIDCSSGMASNQAGARLAFGAMALVNDTFLQIVRSETHRGLEGRALGGFCAGGRVFGYSTEPEKNPPDPERVRKVYCINPSEAAVVRRVFEAYANGASLGAIAASLNADGLPAPYDRDHRKRAGKGWGSSTIRAILRNERYVGRFAWNRRQWFRHPTTGRRVSRERPTDDLVVKELPQLSIVDTALWARVQARFTSRKGALGRPPGISRKPRLLAGLLRCGECGGSMVIATVRKKNGVAYGNYGCAAHLRKGSSVCGNSLLVSERKIDAAILAAVKQTIVSKEFQERVAEEFYKRVETARRRPQGEREALEQAVRAQEVRVQKVTESFARVGFSEALASQLRTEENRLRELKARLSAAHPARGNAPRPLDKAVAERLALRLEEYARKAPERAREALAAVVTPIVLNPVRTGETRGYVAEGSISIDPATLRDGRVDNDGCGGRI